jgi:ABC-type transport system involved in multi-copper enzyme maturation permease subunit
MTTETLSLERIDSTSPLRGLGGLIGVELRVWFPWRVLWLVVAGFGVFAVVYLPWRATSTNQLGVLMNFYLGMWMALLLISTVSMTEGSVLGEIQRGTAAWLAALPITRPSIIISKFVGSMVGLAAVVGGTGLALYPVLADAEGRQITDFSAHHVLEVAGGPIGQWGVYAQLPPFGTYVAMLIGLWLLLGFMVSVMMLLGSFVRSRTATFGLGLFVAGAIIGVGILGSTAVGASPAGLAGAILDIVLGNQSDVLVPGAGTAILTLIVLALAVLSFGRRELT